MNKKIALILACCAATSFAACNETTEWNFTESCDAEAKRCVESTIQVCKDGVWVLEATCEGNTPWCDVATHTCIAQPVVKDCQDGAKKCDQNAVWTCKTGKWEKTTDCNVGDKTCNSTTYVCDPKTQTEVTCDHNGTKLAVDASVCSDDTTLQTCTLNADGTTASLTPTDCSTYSKVCGNDAENKAACIDAQPAPSVKCTKDGDETEYKVGDKYCGDNNTLYTCTLSEDGTTATFEFAPCAGKTPVCDANACRAYNKCAANGVDVEHNATVCDGNVSKKCNDGTLEIVEDCTPAQVCLTESGKCGDAPATACTDTTVGTVNDGEKVCKDNNLWTCDNTQLSQTKACTVTADDTSKSFVATCIAANGDTAAHCDKKCAEDTALNAAGDACEPIDGKNIICRVNNNVAQVKRFWGGQFSEWNNCSDNQEAGTENAAEYGCNDAGDGCIVKSCVAGYHPVKGDNGKYTCEHDITMNCGTGEDGKPFEINSYHCNDDNTKVMVCSAENSTDYTATLQQAAVCDASKGFTCDPKKVGTLEACACTDTMPAKCVEDGTFAKVTSCDSATGKIITTDCTKNLFTTSAKCNEDANACGKPICKDGYVVANGVCGKCDVEGAESCGAGKTCVNGKCVAGEEPACTTDSCSDGMIKKCVDADGSKKYADPVSCIENGVGKCKEGSSTECDTVALSCNVDYMLVENACKKYDTVECTKGVCTDSHYFGCPAVTDGTSYHTKGVEKPAVDANGTWACDVDNGWTLTCNKVDNVEVYEVTESEGKKSCTLRAGMCIADADCTDATKTKCNTTTKVCEASATPAPECSGDAIQCVSDAKYKTCTGDKWGAETDVATGLKCDTTDATAHKLICASDAPKTCDGTKVMGCKDGKLSQEIEDCATNTDKKTCSDGACVAGGGAPAPTKSLIISELIRIGNNGRAIELYNATDSAIDLSKCKVEILASGNATVDITIDNMTGSIESGHVHVICGNKVETTYTSAKGKCNTTANDNLQNMGKKRVVRLSCNGMDVDVLGKLNTSDSFFLEQRNIRKCGIIVGDTNGTDAWDVNTQFDSTKLNDNWNWDSIGTHKAVCDTPTE